MACIKGKRVVLSVMITHETRAALEQAARDQSRSLSDLAHRLLAEGLGLQSPAATQQPKVRALEAA